MNKDISDIQLGKMLCNLHRVKMPAFAFQAENVLKTRPSRVIRFAPAYITAVCLLVVSIILYNAVGFWGNKTENPPIRNSDIPLWYVPQKLNATTITYESTAISSTSYMEKDKVNLKKLSYTAEKNKQNDIVPLDNTDADKTVNNLAYNNIIADYPADVSITKSINAEILDISGGYNSQEHKNCSGLYFDTKKKQVICLSDTIRAAMNLSGDVKIAIDEYGTNLDYVTYTTESDQKSYYLNMKTGVYKELPVSLYGKQLMASVTKDYRYILAAKPKPNSIIDDVILIDTTDLSYKILSNDYDAYMYAQLSDNGKFVCFTVRNEDGSMPNDYKNSNWIIYNIQSKGYFKAKGDLMKFVNDDTKVIFKTAYGFIAIDTAKGKEADIKDTVTGADRYHVYEQPGDNDYNRILLKENITDNSKTTITPKAVNAYALSLDGKYLYTYVLGDPYIKCISIETLEGFDIPIGSEFIGQTVELAKDNRLIFNLSVDKTMTEVLLCYYLVPNRNPNDKPSVSQPSSETNSIPPVQQSWDIRNHSVQETIDKLDFSLVPFSPYFYNPNGSGFDVADSNDLADLIDILKEQKYLKMPLKGINGFNKVFWLSMHNYDFSIIDFIEIGQIDKGGYYIYYQDINGYCYISKETYDKIYEICGKLITFPSPPTEKPKMN